MVTLELMSYWDGFYESSSEKTLTEHEISVELLPSQFAAFACGELLKTSLVIDLGCGLGRDTVLFANVGHRAIGIDFCESAICRANCLKEAKGLNNLDFYQKNINDPSLYEFLCQKIELSGVQGRCSLYSRFFLHALSLELQEDFYKLIIKLKSRFPEIQLLIEYRSKEDESLEKETPDHYRCFIDPLTVTPRFISGGFEEIYYIKGRGFAKYKNDDAIVARHHFK